MWQYFTEAIIFILIPFFILAEGVTSKKNSTRKQKAVILITGWGMPKNYNFALKNYLQSKSFEVYMFNHKLNIQDIKESANELGKFISSNKLPKVSIIGISVGAVVGYYYLQKLNGWKKTDKFVSFLGSHRGSALSYLAPFSGSARQMRPNSEFIKKLLNEKPKNIDKILMVNATNDEFVRNYSNSIKGANSKVVPMVGHFNIQFFKNPSFEIISEFIK